MATRARARSAADRGDRRPRDGSSRARRSRCGGGALRAAARPRPAAAHRGALRADARALARRSSAASTRRAQRCAARRSPAARPRPKRTRCSPRSPRPRDDREHAAAELDTAISVVRRARRRRRRAATSGCYARAAELAVARATLLDSTGQPQQATADWERAHELAHDARAGRSRAMPRARCSTRADDAAHASGAGSTRCSRRGRRRPSARRCSSSAPTCGAASARPISPRRSPICTKRSQLHRGRRPEQADAAPPRVPARGRAAREERRSTRTRAGTDRARADRRARARSRRGRDRRRRRVARRRRAGRRPAPRRARTRRARRPTCRRALRREVLTTLGEAAWRQRAWPDVIRAYRGLVDDPGVDTGEASARIRYRLAVAADRTRRRAASRSTRCARSSTTRAECRRRARDARPTFAARRCGCTRISPSAPAISPVPRPRSKASPASRSKSTPSARADAMYRAGELFRRADRRDDAVRCLEAALRISDTHLPALDALELAWRERGDLERVAVILGRKVAATGAPSAAPEAAALAARRSAGSARPSRRRARDASARARDRFDVAAVAALRDARACSDDGQLVAAAGGFAQLAGELPATAASTSRSSRASASSRRKRSRELVADARRRAARSGPRDRASPHSSAPRSIRRIDVAGPRTPARRAGAAHATRLRRGEHAERPRASDAAAGALSLRDAATRARAAGKLDDAFASLEAANHVSPGDQDVLRELVELATELGDHEAAAQHLRALADSQTGARKGDALLAARRHLLRPARRRGGRARRRCARPPTRSASARAATRRCACSRRRPRRTSRGTSPSMRCRAIEPQRRTGADIVAARDRARARGQAPATRSTSIEEATAQGKFDDGGTAARRAARRAVAQGRRRARARRARDAPSGARRDELRVEASGAVARDRRRRPASRSVGRSIGAMQTAPRSRPPRRDAMPTRARDSCSPRSARRPTIRRVLLALLAHLGDREPALRREVLERVAADGSGPRAGDRAARARAARARRARSDPRRGAVDEGAPRRPELRAGVDAARRCARRRRRDRSRTRALRADRRVDATTTRTAARWAARARRGARPRRLGRLGRDRRAPHAATPPPADARRERARARRAATTGRPRSRSPKRAAEAEPRRHRRARAARAALLRGRRHHRGVRGDRPPAACSSDDPDAARALWRRRAKLYRDALGRDAEAYRCLKEAHACAPADPEIAYQLRTAAMVRGEWALVASLLYREIAAAPTPRDRGALHLELALIFEEKLDDAGAGAGQLRAGARVRSDDSRREGAARAPLRGDRPPRRCREALRGSRATARARRSHRALLKRPPRNRAPPTRDRRPHRARRAARQAPRPPAIARPRSSSRTSCGAPSPAIPPRSACSRPSIARPAISPRSPS